MTWFERISAHLISFWSIVFHILSYSPCLHCFVFFLVHIYPHPKFVFSFIVTITLPFLIPFLPFITDIFIFFLSFLLIYPLDVFRSITSEIFCTYCILYTRVWDFIIGIVESSFLSFLYPITLAYVASQVLRSPWGHDITHCVLIAFTWAILRIGQRAFWFW